MNDALGMRGVKSVSNFDCEQNNFLAIRWSAGDPDA